MHRHMRIVYAKDEKIVSFVALKVVLVILLANKGKK